MRFSILVTSLALTGCKKEIDTAKPDRLEAFSKCQGYERGGEDFSQKRSYEVKGVGECVRSGQTFRKPVRVRFFFVRHAEAKWGTVSNIKQKMKMPPVEQTDVHLTSNGIAGAMSLNRWIFSTPCEGDQCFLAGRPEEKDAGRRVVFAVSNLRRAVLTALIAFEDRISTSSSSEDTLKINNFHVLSSLGETTPNIDSSPLAPPRSVPYLTFSDAGCPFKLRDMKKFFLLECSLDEAPSHDDFCEWMRKQVRLNEPTAEVGPVKSRTDRITDFVIVGHSIWIRHFFKQLPGTQRSYIEKEIASGTRKFPNQGVVKFEVELPPEGGCNVVPGQTAMVYGEMESRHPMLPKVPIF